MLFPVTHTASAGAWERLEREPGSFMLCQPLMCFPGWQSTAPTKRPFFFSEQTWVANVFQRGWHFALFLPAGPVHFRNVRKSCGSGNTLSPRNPLMGYHKLPQCQHIHAGLITKKKISLSLNRHTTQ